MYNKSNGSTTKRNCKQFISMLGIRRRIASLMLVGSLPLLLGATCGFETCDIFNCDSLFFVEGFFDSMGDMHDEGDEHVDDDHGDLVDDDDMDGMADDHDDMDGMEDEHDDMDGEHDDDMHDEGDEHIDDDPRDMVDMDGTGAVIP